MRFTRGFSLSIAICCLLLGVGFLASGESRLYLRLVEEAGAGYINHQVVAVLLMIPALVAVVLFGASWASRRRGDAYRERNQVRWGVGFTAVTVAGFAVYGLARTGAAAQAQCGSWGYGAAQCRRVQDGAILTGEVLLIGSIICAVLLVIALMTARVGQRDPVPPPPAVGQRADDGDLVRQLRELGQLREQGLLTDQEFEMGKRRLLGESGNGSGVE